jgi:hypothetical protein
MKATTAVLISGIALGGPLTRRSECIRDVRVVTVAQTYAPTPATDETSIEAFARSIVSLSSLVINEENAMFPKENCKASVLLDLLVLAV